MQSILLLVLQIMFLLGSLIPTGHKYIGTTPQIYNAFKFSMLSINICALILELVFINDVNMCRTILLLCVIATGIALTIIESVGKKKHYELLKQRIQIVQKDSLIHNSKEMQAVLVEKFDKLYSISDIQKVYTDF